MVLQKYSYLRTLQYDKSMSEQSFNNGRFQYNVSYRRFRGDEGLSITLRGPVKSESRDLMRYDCFLKTPHFHTAVYGHNTIKAIDGDEDAVAWSLSELDGSFVELVSSAGGDDPNDSEREAHDGVVADVCDYARKLVTAEQAN